MVERVDMSPTTSLWPNINRGSTQSGLRSDEKSSDLLFHMKSSQKDFKEGNTEDILKTKFI